jgi:hypothetical protein
MGFLQSLEGLFGFGKKANTPVADAAAIAAAESAVQALLNDASAVEAVIAPLLTAVPGLSGFTAIAAAVTAFAEEALTEIKSLTPASAPAPTVTPAS